MCDHRKSFLTAIKLHRLLVQSLPIRATRRDAIMTIPTSEASDTPSRDLIYYESQSVLSYSQVSVRPQKIIFNRNEIASFARTIVAN